MFRELALFDGAGPTRRDAAASCPRTLRCRRIEAFDRAAWRSRRSPSTTTCCRGRRVSVQVTPGAPEGGALVAEMRLEEMWRLVDRLRVGTRGFALLVDRDGRLIAHGNPDQKAAVARGGDSARSSAGHGRARSLAGVARRRLGVRRRPAARRPRRGRAAADRRSWTLVLEQPTSDAYALLLPARACSCYWSIAIALLVTVALGYSGDSRSSVRSRRCWKAPRRSRRASWRRASASSATTSSPRSATRSTAWPIGSPLLQEEARRQERQAMFGRIAAGLVHDLSHPIQNIGNNCRLILKMHDDPEYRDTFRRTVERELQASSSGCSRICAIWRGPFPLERLPDRSRALRRRGRREHAVASPIAPGCRSRYDAAQRSTSRSKAMSFALGRVYRNLILNAIQATAPGGEVRVSVDAIGRPRAHARARHRLRHPAGSPRRHLRGLRDDEAPRPGPGPADLEEDRRAAGRHDRGAERRGRRDDRHDRVPANGAGRAGRDAQASAMPARLRAAPGDERVRIGESEGSRAMVGRTCNPAGRSLATSRMRHAVRDVTSAAARRPSSA